MQRLSEEDHRKLYKAMSELEPLATLVKQLEAKQEVSAQYVGTQCELGCQGTHTRLYVYIWLARYLLCDNNSPSGFCMLQVTNTWMTGRPMDELVYLAH